MSRWRVHHGVVTAKGQTKARFYYDLGPLHIRLPRWFWEFMTGGPA